MYTEHVSVSPFSRFKVNIMLLTSAILSFSEKGAAAAGGTVSHETVRNGAPSTSVHAQREMKRPVLDTAKMSRAELVDKINELSAAQSPTRTAVKTIRFNDGTDPNFYNEGEARVSGDSRPGLAKSGEIKSARNSGTISIYGFGVRPISMYPAQWLDLFSFAPEVTTFIRDNVDLINDYLASRNNGSHARDINEQQLAQLCEVFELLTPSEKAGEVAATTGEGEWEEPDDLELAVGAAAE